MLHRLITMSTPSRSSLGKYGEDFACRYLQNMGYKILTRNFRCHRYGEIDIIVEKSGCISFIECERTNRSVTSTFLSVTKSVFRKTDKYIGNQRVF